MTQVDEALLAGHDEGYKRWAVALVVAFPSLGGLLFGYDIGATSYVVPALEKVFPTVKHSAVVQGVITSGGVGGALVGAALAFRYGDVLGRRREILLGNACYALGALLEATAAQLWILVVGRLVYGIGCGLVMHGAPAYIAEMSPKHLRGALVACKEAAIVCGICLGYLSGYFCPWRWAYGLACPLAVVSGMGMFGLPPSVRWLAQTNPDTVEAAWHFVFLPDTPLENWDEIATSKEPLLKYTPQLRAGLGVVVLQQLTGQPSVLYYATAVFGRTSAVWIGLFKVAATLAAVATVETKGRVFLLYAGTSVMLAALAGLVVFVGSPPSLYFVFLYISGYQVGFGPVAWLLISELFPLSVRARAVAVAVETNFAANLLVTFLFPIAATVSLRGLFVLFAALALVALAFFASIPETKGRSLEDIARLFEVEQQ